MRIAVPLPPPVPKHTPLTERHPLVMLIPPANVEVEVFVTVRLVNVVVPRLPIITLVNVAPSIFPPVIERIFVVPPLIVGLFITVFVN